MEWELASVTILVFCVLELLNVAVLVWPSQRIPVFSNGLTQFEGWAEPKTRYFGYWVANVKVGMVALLVAIAVEGSSALKTAALGIMTVTALLFFVHMLPTLNELVRKDEVASKSRNYLVALMAAIVLALGTVFVLMLLRTI